MRTVRMHVFVISVLAALAAGFVGGMAVTSLGKTFLAGLFDHEKPANVANPNTHRGRQFAVQYPSNWRIDTDDEDYNPDDCITIDSPGSAFATLRIGKGAVAADNLIQTFVREYEKIMTLAATERFEHYGSFTGRGVLMKGRILTLPTTVRIFVGQHSGGNFTLIEQCPNEDRRRVQPGLDLIERTLTFEGR